MTVFSMVYKDYYIILYYYYYYYYYYYIDAIHHTSGILRRVYPMIGNDSVNTFPPKQMRATLRSPLLDNGSVNMPP
jgi:hypothetical protein